MECPNCKSELTHYTEQGSLTFSVSVERGRLVMRLVDVDFYDDTDGSFYCGDCGEYVEAHELRELFEKVEVFWAQVKEVVSVPVT